MSTDPDESLTVAENRCGWPCRPSAVVYGACISTDHTAPEPLIRAACATLRTFSAWHPHRHLATGTGDGGVLAYIEQHLPATTGC